MDLERDSRVADLGRLAILFLLLLVIAMAVSFGAASARNRGAARGTARSTPPGSPTASLAMSWGSSTASWHDSATGLGKPGDRFQFHCPPGGTAGTVWGDGIYTADSSVCTAAVHAGLLTLANGGTVTIEIEAGQSAYGGSTRHGVTTRAYGSWSASFVFPGSSWFPSFFGSNAPTPPPSPIPTLAPPTPMHGVAVVGDRRTVACSGGEIGSVWGSDPYTADSNVCVAAVHAGVLKPGAGGPVTIEYTPGLPTYRGSTRNGVRTSAWNAYPTSFVFPGASGPRSIEAAFMAAGMGDHLDRPATSPGPLSWEVSIFRDGTALLAQRRERRLVTVVADAALLSSGDEGVRLALSGTIYRHEPSRTVGAPVEAEIVLRRGAGGVLLLESSRTLGVDPAGVELTPD